MRVRLVVVSDYKYKMQDSKDRLAHTWDIRSPKTLQPSNWRVGALTTTQNDIKATPCALKTIADKARVENSKNIKKKIKAAGPHRENLLCAATVKSKWAKRVEGSPTRHPTARWNTL